MKNSLREAGSRYAPIVVYVVTYGATCLIGGLFLVLGQSWFVDTFELNAGTTVPDFEEREIATNLRLLVVAPLLVCAGYLLGLWLRRPGGRGGAEDRRTARAEDDPPRYRAAWAVFGVLALAATVSLARGGAFTRLDAWLDYDDFIASRAQLFERLGFFEFVNLYLLVPLAAAWVLVSPAPKRRAWMNALPVAVAVAFSLLLYQKKPAVVTILIATSSWLLAHPRESSRLARRILAGGVVAMAVIYFTAVIVPISARADTETGVPREVDDLALYAALAPLTRTAGAAVYYPTVFPEQHEFYGLDLGQDLLGFGEFPDDNLVVYDAMYPGGRGTAAAPFQFVLYSQVGLVGGLLGSAAVGAILALLWRIGRASAWPRAYASLFGALTILLAVYYAMESLRNGVLVSYGVLWGYLFVLLLAGLTAAAARIRAGGSRLRVPWLDGPNADEPAESRPGQVRKTADDAPVVGRHETT